MLMRILLILAATFGLAWVGGRFRKRTINMVALLAWGVLWVLVAAVAVQPEFASRIADLLGIGRGADVVVYSAIVLLLALVFRLSVRIEQLDRDITKVTRTLALRDRTTEDENEVLR